MNPGPGLFTLLLFTLSSTISLQYLKTFEYCEFLFVYMFKAGSPQSHLNLRGHFDLQNIFLFSSPC